MKAVTITMVILTVFSVFSASVVAGEREVAVRIQDPDNGDITTFYKGGGIEIVELSRVEKKFFYAKKTICPAASDVWDYMNSPNFAPGKSMQQRAEILLRKMGRNNFWVLSRSHREDDLNWVFSIVKNGNKNKNGWHVEKACREEEAWAMHPYYARVYARLRMEEKYKRVAKE